MNREGVTAVLADHQAWMLLQAPSTEMLTGKCDQTILVTLLYHAIRREELCALKDWSSPQQRQDVPSLRINRKEHKVGYIEAATDALGLLETYIVVPRHERTWKDCRLGPSRTTPPKPWPSS